MCDIKSTMYVCCYVGERGVDAEAMVTALQLSYSILLQEVCHDDLSTSFLLSFIRADGHTVIHTTVGDDQGVEDLAVLVG